MKSKKYLKVFIAGLLSTGFFAGNSIAADAKHRVRLHLPVQATYEGERLVDKASKMSVKSVAGYGLHYVHPVGFGFGLTETTLAVEDKGSQQILGIDINHKQEYESKAQFFDLSYTFGTDLTLTLALGTVIGGSFGDISYDNKIGNSSTSGKEKIKESTTTGSAFSLGTGYDFGGIEGLLTYRVEAVAHTAKKENGNDITNYDGKKKLKMDRSLIQLGIGFTF